MRFPICKTVLMAALVAAPSVTRAASEKVLAGGPVPDRFVVGGRFGHPLKNLPPGSTQILAFGERPVISPDGRKVAFVDRFLGDAFEYDIVTGATRNLTAHTPHVGISRVHYLPDGSYVLVAPRELGANPRETRRGKLELFWMDAAAAGPLQALDQPVFEGIAVSRTSNKIAWTINNPRDVYPLAPDAKGMATLMVGDVVVSGGRAKLIGGRTIKSTPFDECVLEAQDILPNDQAVVVPCYNNDGKVGGHRVWSVAINDGKVTNYPVPLHLYGEVEGVFPDGKHAFIECGNSHTEGLDLCLLELRTDRPRYSRITYAQDYGNYRFSNPTVSADGKLVAFQFGYATDEPGAGRGIVLMTVPPVGA